MKIRIILQFMVIAVVAGVGNLAAQSLDELKTRYPAGGIFKIRPNILMTPYYGVKGNLCFAFIQANRFSSPPHSIDAGKIEPHVLAEVIQELAPKETQIEVGKYFFRRSGENLKVATFLYSDLSVQVYGQTTTRQSNASSGDKSAPNYKVIDSTLLEFLVSFGDIDVVRIGWNRRDGCHDR